MKNYRGYNYSKQGETYIIYNEGEAWIVGFKTEEKVKAQIDDLVRQDEDIQREQTNNERIEALEDAVNALLGF